MTKQFFSDVNRLHQPSSGLIVNDIPKRARNAVNNHLSATLQLRDFTYVAIQMVQDLDWEGSLVTSARYLNYDYKKGELVERVILEVPFADWLDVMSSIFHHFGEVSELKAQDFREALNTALMRHYSAYQMDETGLMVEAGSAAAGEAAGDARALLRDGALEGPDRQFQEALLNLMRRPDPNPEAAVASATNALEGLVRKVLNDPKIKLGDGIKKVAADHKLHGALQSSLSSLYGYASDAGGRHGLTGQPDADLRIAEFVVHQVAAAIVLIARLYGYGVK